MRELKFVVPIKVYWKLERERMKFSLNKCWAGWAWTQWLRKSKANLWHDEVNAIIDYLQISPFTCKVDLEFKYVFKLNSLDTSNCAVMSKLVEDALVRKGIILGDENDKVGKITTESINLPLSLRRHLSWDYVEVTVIERNLKQDGENVKRIETELRGIGTEV